MIDSRQWEAEQGTRRLFARDASLWTGTDEAKWLGWLDLPDQPVEQVAGIQRLAHEIQRDGMTDAVVLGMGGSSLCAFIIATVSHVPQGALRIHVLDSTDPEQILELQQRLDLSRTLFVVASKSGSTLEPSIMRDHFLAAVREKVGPERAGRHFVAITDPGSQLEREAKADGFRGIVFGEPSVGGRFSALSPFGLLPAALLGFRLDALLGEARSMSRRSGSETLDDNPAVKLGLLIGEQARAGRDKLTLIITPRYMHFGAWLEQLIAESTGKQGKMVLPVDREPDGTPQSYGDDRFFVYLRFGAGDPRQEQVVAALEQSGRPVHRVDMVDEVNAIGAEFYRWEIATAVAGAVLGINPFNQPDVESTKIETRRLMDAVEREGSLPAETPFFEEGGVALFADAANQAALERGARERSLTGFLRAHVDRAGAGDYFATLAYVPMNDANEKVLQSMRCRVRDARRVATALGFGPRYLHSTGQAYKGGPNTGVFLQVTRTAARDLPVAGRRYSFGIVEAAQARGDFAVLCERGRRALRVHLPADVTPGLAALETALQAALAK